MFEKMMVKHKTYGDGKVTDFEMNPTDELKSRVTVVFNNDIEKKFPVSSFNNRVFKNLPEKVTAYVTKLLTEKEVKEAQKRAEIANKVIFIPGYKYDEEDRKITKVDWERCLKVADSYRFPHESRAVVMDEELIFINAACGLKECGANPKLGNHVYARCEGKEKTKYAGCHWRYATKEEIAKIIEGWDNTDADIE